VTIKEERGQMKLKRQISGKNVTRHQSQQMDVGIAYCRCSSEGKISFQRGKVKSVGFFKKTFSPAFLW
jgi:hypothetical protein